MAQMCVGMGVTRLKRVTRTSNTLSNILENTSDVFSILRNVLWQNRDWSIMTNVEIYCYQFDSILFINIC